MGEELDLDEIYDDFCGRMQPTKVSREDALAILHTMERFLDNSNAIDWVQVPEYYRLKPDE